MTAPPVFGDPAGPIDCHDLCRATINIHEHANQKVSGRPSETNLRLQDDSSGSRIQSLLRREENIPNDLLAQAAASHFEGRMWGDHIFGDRL
jgi:hypothetical protein